MTDEKYDGLVIIMAGYQPDVMSMLDTNPGLKSRFQHFLEFPDWASKDCLDLFLKKLNTGNFEYDAAGETYLHSFCLPRSPLCRRCSRHPSCILGNRGAAMS